MDQLRIQNNLFDMSDDQIEASKMMYNDKVIKCLVAPYHSKSIFESVLKYTPSAFLFPETEISSDMARSFINTLVNSPITEDIHIITTDMSIIIDMIDSSVRVLTEGGFIVPSPEKTFMANIHTIRYKLLENKDHRTSDASGKVGHDKINAIITKINDHIDKNEKITEKQYNVYRMTIDTIGEPIISKSLLDRLNSVNVDDGLTENERKIRDLQAQIDKMS